MITELIQKHTRLIVSGCVPCRGGQRGIVLCEESFSVFIPQSEYERSQRFPQIKDSFYGILTSYNPHTNSGVCISYYNPKEIIYRAFQFYKDKIDDTIECIVTEKKDSGAYILSPVVGPQDRSLYLPKEEVSYYKQTTFNIGDTISVKILKVTPKNIYISHRAVEKHPYEFLEENEPQHLANILAGEIILVRVLNQTEYGVFAEYRNILGLFHFKQNPTLKGFDLSGLIMPAKVIGVTGYNFQLQSASKLDQETEDKTYLPF